MKKGYVIAMALIALAGIFSGTAIGARLLTGSDVRNESLSGSDIRNGSLTEQELSRKVRNKLNGRGGPNTPNDPRPGPQGPQGPMGPQGPAGAAQPVSPITRVNGPGTLVAPGQADGDIAQCPSGMKVISGGGFFIAGSSDDIFATIPSDDNTAWIVVGFNGGASNAESRAVAYCATPGGAASASARRQANPSVRTIRQLQRLRTQAEAARR